MKLKALVRSVLFLVAGGMLFATSSGIQQVNAAEWKPSGPITVLIGFSAGGGTDIECRLYARHLNMQCSHPRRLDMPLRT